jgi:hypothetical protein
LQANSAAPSLYITTALLATSRATTVKTSLSSLLYSCFNSLSTSIVSLILLQLDVSATPLLYASSTIILSTTLFELEPLEAQKQYNLRPRAVEDSLAQLLRQNKLSLLAEFHAYINEPTSKDTVV